MQHDCARVKLDVLKSEIAEADKLDKEATPLDMKKYLGRYRWYPRSRKPSRDPNLDEDGEFNYNNLLNPNATDIAALLVLRGLLASAVLPQRRMHPMHTTKRHLSGARQRQTQSHSH